MTAEQKKRLLKAKIAVALQSELGCPPKTEEIEEVTMLARVLYRRYSACTKEKGTEEE
jgi:hypothetical protein